MNPTSIIALFCDDIRAEESGALMLLGVFSDNINVGLPPELPPEGKEGKTFVRMIPRMGVYIRINFDVEAKMGPITVRVTMPDGEIIHEGPIEEETVAKARATQLKGNPVAGLIQRLQFGGVPLKQLGRITAEVTIGDQNYLAGYVNFISE